MNAETGDPRLPDVVLERFHLDELPPDEARAIEARLTNDAALRQRVDALHRSDEEIRRTYSPDWLADRIRARLHRRQMPRGRVRYWGILAAAGAMAVLALMILPRRSVPVSPPSGTQGAPSNSVSPEDSRIKGLAPTLTVYRRTATTTETLADGTVVRRGDLVRIAYTSAGRPYGVILSIDGRGGITRHLPVDGEVAAALEPGAAVLLDRSFELDDAPRWERFYFVTGASRFAVAPVLESARRTAVNPQPTTSRLTLPKGLEQFTLTLQKEDRP